VRLEEGFMPGQTDSSSAEEWWRTIENCFRMMTMASASWTPGEAATGGSEGGRAASPGALGFAAQASLACLNSGMRYWQRMAELSGSYYLTLSRTAMEMQADPTRGAEAQASLFDALRAYFRDIAALPGQESQRLQAELERLEQQMGATATSQEDAPYWRRWRVKP
jgi:hypothetical protein